jgi:DNA adenine methylase
MTDIEIIKPLLKWVGGKTQIIEDILTLIPKEINNYYEPFLGGGSVLFAVLSYKMYGEIDITGRIYASDVNENLIHFYKNIQSDAEGVISEFKKIVNEYNSITGTVVKRLASTMNEALTSPESYYYWMRKTYNNLTDEDKTTTQAAAIFLFMNKTCFRGLYRESMNGGFNVPYGYYKRPFLIDEQHIRDISQLIEDVIFTCKSFEESIAVVNESNDFIYMDPPYAPENASSFVGYTASGFKIDAHLKLFRMCKDASSRKVSLLMSNADVKLVRDNFPEEGEFITKTISCRRAVNPYDTGSTANEVLISNY